MMFKTYSEKRTEWGHNRLLQWYAWRTLKLIGIVPCQVYVESSVPADQHISIPSDYSIRQMTPTGLIPYTGKNTLDAEFLQQAEQRGDYCAAIFQGDELVGYRFASCTRAPVTPQLDIIIPQGFSYGYKAWIKSEHRRKHLDKAAANMIDLVISRETGRRSIWYIEKGNFPSRMSGYKHPSERPLRMGTCGWLTVFGRQIPFNSRTARWVGIRIVQKDDPGTQLQLI